MRHPWNFIFQKCFWRKRYANDRSCTSAKLKDEHVKETATAIGTDVLPAIEAISLEMKQQELDDR